MNGSSPNCPTQSTTSRATRPLLPVTPGANAVLDTLGTDQIAALLLQAHTYAAVAELLDIPAHSLAAWIHNRPDDQRATLRAALMASAETLIDEAGAIVDEVRTYKDPETGGVIELMPSAAEVAWRKLRAEHRYRRAAQRNSAYREKAPTDPDGAQDTVAPPTFHFNITVSDAPLRKVIDITPEE